MKITYSIPKRKLVVLAVLLASLSAATLHGRFEFRHEQVRDKDKPYEAIPVLTVTDRIGWSSDGNTVDPDDWAATPVALAIIAANGMHDKLVHFSYNNRLDRSVPMKVKESKESTIGAAKRFGFNQEKFYDLDDSDEYQPAFEAAISEILASSDESKFYWIQAGPFEFAYRVLQEAVVNRGATRENLRNVILISHSGVNEREDKWTERDAISGKERPSAGAQMCVEDFGVGFFFTGSQGTDRFGSKTNREAWKDVEWMKTSDCEAFRWMHSRFKVMSERYQEEREANKGRDGLDASDGGMAYTLVMGDYKGNFKKFTKLVKDYCGER